MVATITPSSPPILAPIIVATDDAKIVAKVLPIKIAPIWSS